MSAYGIYFLILTIGYIIYYSVVISMDLFGKKGGSKSDVEEIPVGIGVDDDEDKPAVVRESKNGSGFSIGSESEEEAEPEPGSVDEFDNDSDMNDGDQTFGNADSQFDEEEQRLAAEDALYQELSEAVNKIDDVERSYQYTYDSAAMSIALGKKDTKIRVSTRTVGNKGGVI